MIYDDACLTQHRTEAYVAPSRFWMMAQYESISVDLMIQGERKAAVVERAPVMDDGGSRNGPYDLLYRRMLRHLRLRCMWAPRYVQYQCTATIKRLSLAEHAEISEVERSGSGGRKGLIYGKKTIRRSGPVPRGKFRQMIDYVRKQLLLSFAQTLMNSNFSSSHCKFVWSKKDSNIPWIVG